MDDDDEAWDFSSTKTLLMVESGNKSFCSTHSNLLVLLLILWWRSGALGKDCAEDGCSVDHCMNLWGLVPATWILLSDKKHPTSSITPFETFNQYLPVGN